MTTRLELPERYQTFQVNKSNSMIGPNSKN